MHPHFQNTANKQTVFSQGKINKLLREISLQDNGDLERKRNLEEEMLAASKAEIDAATKYAQECDAEWFRKYIAGESDHDANASVPSVSKSLNEDNRSYPKIEYPSEKRQHMDGETDYFKSNRFDNQRYTRERDSRVRRSDNQRIESDSNNYGVDGRQILMSQLGYSEEDVFTLAPEIISILIEKKIYRPLGKIPADWKKWMSSDDRQYTTPRNNKKGQPSGQIDEEDEPLFSLPSLNEFKEMIKKETEWRLDLTGGWAADLVRAENRFRLAAYDAFVSSVEQSADKPSPETVGAVWDKKRMEWMFDSRLQYPQDHTTYPRDEQSRSRSPEEQDEGESLWNIPSAQKFYSRRGEGVGEYDYDRNVQEKRDFEFVRDQIAEKERILNELDAVLIKAGKIPPKTANQDRRSIQSQTLLRSESDAPNRFQEIESKGQFAKTKDEILNTRKGTLPLGTIPQSSGDDEFSDFEEC